MNGSWMHWTLPGKKLAPCKSTCACGWGGQEAGSWGTLLILAHWPEHISHARVNGFRFRFFSPALLKGTPFTDLAGRWALAALLVFWRSVPKCISRAYLFPALFTLSCTVRCKGFYLIERIWRGMGGLAWCAASSCNVWQCSLVFLIVFSGEITFSSIDCTV